MTTLTDRLNAIRERAERAWSEDDAEKFPATCSDSQNDVLPLLEAVEEVLDRLKEVDSWHVYDTRDMGDAYPADIVQDLAEEIQEDVEKSLGGGEDEQ